MLSFAFWATVINYMDRQTLSVAAPVLREQFHMSNVAYSRVVFAFLLAYTIMNGASGPLIDRLGTRLGYALTMAWWSAAAVLHALAHGALRDMGIRSIAEPALYRLASETGLSAGIGVLERGRVLIVDRVEGAEFVRDAVEIAAGAPDPWPGVARKYRIRAERDIGRELPAHSTALGKVLMAPLAREEALALIPERGLARQTRKTIVSKARFMEELALVRKQGYATADEEHHAGIRSIAAPIFGASSTVTAAVALNGGLAEAAWREPAVLVERVKAAGREISRRARVPRRAID